MKKIAIALAASLALSVAAPAYAVGVILEGGQLNGGFTVYNGDASNMHGEVDAKVDLGLQAEGLSAEAEVTKLFSGTPTLGEYKVELYDPLLRVTAWGKGKEISDKQDPFEFVKSAEGHDGTIKVRAEAGPVAADLDDNGALFLFGEQEVSDHTLGAAVHRDLTQGSGFTAVGYGKTTFADVALIGAVGMTMDEGVTDENIGFGIKAEAPVLPTLTAAVTYKSEPANFIGNKKENALTVEGNHEAALTQASAAFTRTLDAANGDLVSDVLEATANWRGSDANLDWDDQFEGDQYFNNIAPAIQAKVKQTRDNSEPATEFTVKGTMPLIANRLWVNGSLVNTIDEDSDLSAQVSNLAESADIVFANVRRHMMVQADGYFKASEKLALEPGAMYLTASNASDDTYVKLGGKASYQVAPSGKLIAEYAQDYVNKAAYDSKLGLGFEVEF